MTEASGLRLNLGCGRDYRDGWVNVDHPAADVRCDASWDFDVAAAVPFEHGTVDHAEGKHVLEHLVRPLEFMEALWFAMVPDGTAMFRLPYGSSDDAWEDPTHVRPYFLHSFGYFSQPFYWRADYGYRGDWITDRITLVLKPAYEDADHNELVRALHRDRNVVREMVVELHAVKPAREARAELQVPPEVAFAR